MTISAEANKVLEVWRVLAAQEQTLVVDDKALVSSEHATAMLETLGPVVSTLLAVQSRGEFELWMATVRAMVADKDSLLPPPMTKQ